eukprot:Em0016g76a
MRLENMLYNKIEDTVYHKLDKHRPTRSAPHEQLGTELNSVGSTVFTGSPIGKDGAMSFQTLSDYVRVETKLGQADKQFQEKVQAGIHHSLKAFLEVDIKAAVAAEERLRNAQTLYDTQLAKVRDMLNNHIRATLQQPGHLPRLLAAQKAYYTEYSTKFRVGTLELDSEDTRRARVLYDYEANGFDELSVFFVYVYRRLFGAHMDLKIAATTPMPQAQGKASSGHDQRKKRVSQDGIVGLVNIGNSCYMNAALQALSNCNRHTRVPTLLLTQLHEETATLPRPWNLQKQHDIIDIPILQGCQYTETSNNKACSNLWRSRHWSLVLYVLDLELKKVVSVHKKEIPHAQPPPWTMLHPRTHPQMIHHPRTCPQMVLHPRTRPQMVLPPKDTPSDDAPPKDTPSDDAPPKDTPSDDASPKDTPTDDAPPKDTPSDDAPPKGMPSDDALSTEPVHPIDNTTSIENGIEPTTPTLVPPTVSTTMQITTPTGQVSQSTIHEVLSVSETTGNMNNAASNGPSSVPDCGSGPNSIPESRGGSTPEVKSKLSHTQDGRSLDTSVVARSQHRVHRVVRSIVTEMFEGTLVSKVKCFNCKKASVTQEIFQDLALPIPGRKEMSKFAERTVSLILTLQLDDCLNAYFDSYELKGDNRYFCSNCNSFQTSVKKDENHQTAENTLRNQWYEYNDTHVTPVSTGTVAGAEGYVLFYRKTSESRPGCQSVDIGSVVPSQSTTISSFYISRHWLLLLKHHSNPGPIFCEYVCQHGGILPSRRIEEVSTKVVSVAKETWEELMQRYGGGPALRSLEVCVVCQDHLKSLNERREKEKKPIYIRYKRRLILQVLLGESHIFWLTHGCNSGRTSSTAKHLMSSLQEP